MLSSGQIVHIQAGQLEQRTFEGRVWETAIYKHEITGPASIVASGVAGDEHTGDGPVPDRAVCVHSAAHYAFWRAYFRREIPLGFFGENLTIAGLVEEDLCVGDRVRCGQVVLEIAQPRTPCYKQARKMNVPSFVKLLTQTGRIGFLLRVVETGAVQVGEQFNVIERPYPEANLAFVIRLRYGERDQGAMRELAAHPALAEEWRDAFRARLDNRNE